MNTSLFELSTDVSGGCCLSTNGVGGGIALAVYFLSIPAPEGSSDMFVRSLGCNLDTVSYKVLCVLLLSSILSFRFALPGKWRDFCIGSNITFLCGMVRFTTCFTAWVSSFCWFSFSSVTVVIVFVVFWVRDFGITVCFCFQNCSLRPRPDICLSSVESIGFYNVFIDYSGGVLVRVFRSF